MNNDEAILDVQNIEKTYRSGAEKLTILRDLSFSVERGTKAVITGSSGCGKSTLLNIIAGLDVASSGTVRAGTFTVSALSEEELTAYRARFLGLVFQFHYLLKDFTALENVFMPAYMAGMKKRAALDKARDLLHEVGLDSRIHHMPSQLSGGERQRVAVARSLINDPSLVLADEPTGNLDPANARLVGELLFSLTDKYGKTLILVTHDSSLAANADVSYTIRGGRLVTL